jgi:hypothetical protein
MCSSCSFMYVEDVSPRASCLRDGLLEQPLPGGHVGLDEAALRQLLACARDRPRRSGASRLGVGVMVRLHESARDFEFRGRCLIRPRLSLA